MSVLNTTSGPDPTNTTTSESISNPPKTYTYYHAGPLFTLAELHTNVLLSRSISQLSGHKYQPILPQDLEQRDLSPHSIRDTDIRALLACDLALFTYDGHELDAGTVVEYMIAKFADIPAVILRTDFRSAGDQMGDGDAWNLMSSFWPRTKGVTVDAMRHYKEVLARETSGGAEEVFAKEIAGKVVKAFDEVVALPPRLPKELREGVYQWLAMMPGFRDGGDQENLKRLAGLCTGKIEKGLL